MLELEIIQTSRKKESLPFVACKKEKVEEGDYKLGKIGKKEALKELQLDYQLENGTHRNITIDFTEKRKEETTDTLSRVNIQDSFPVELLEYLGESVKTE